MSSPRQDLSVYKVLDQISHILQLPDTYIGSKETVNADLWTFDDSSNTIIQKNIPCNFGLQKITDEILVNALDHHVRVSEAIRAGKPHEIPVTQISVEISRESGTIKISNNGTPVPVDIHPTEKIYIPELIFANLRSSSNYNTDEKRIVGGRNGLGSKLTAVFSKWFRVEIVDQHSKKKYTQEYKNNLREICPPVIEKLKGSGIKSYVSIEFLPDYEKFGFDTLTSEMFALLKRRTYDICACADKSVKVSFNGEPLPIKNFKQYISLYIGEDKFVYESGGDRWEYAVAVSPLEGFAQVSFVNGIATSFGGKHVDYIMNQITKKIADYIEKKKKITVRSTTIRDQLILFLRCSIENPSFDSQAKTTMSLPVAKFGSTCTVSDAFCEKVAKLVMDLVCDITQARENRAAARKTDGSKTKNVRGIANFIDANYAGTEKSGECTLILCEGLSAQSGVVSGLSSNDRNYIGIYPLKGKVLNVRGETATKIAANKEITDLKKIMGLENGRTYTPDDIRTRLRYGKIMILTDADADGSHIKALCVNLFHCEWSSLVRAAGFLSFMNTPILRATRGKQTLSFYNEHEYEAWKEEIGAGAVAGWKIKYFKGLGTSTSAEFKEYFANKKEVNFVYTDKSTDNKIDQIFNKKRADERKTWLENYDKGVSLDTSNPLVKYEDFIDKELIHFSVYDCERSIPNLMDGLKISLRKILYCAFKRRLTSEVKVAQFSGYVSEHSMYHHGEASLNAAIVNMAQNFVGSNNINLLEPKGQFGTRLQGGEDSASERYIFTQLNDLVRAIFPEADDNILTYLNDDGTMVEPEFYVPVIPFALVNGLQGIGTGFSTSIPSYNPLDLVEYLRAMLRGAPATERELVPYYEGFRGTVHRIEDKKYLIKGVYEHAAAADTITITELPVGTWTMPYITFLEELLDPAPDKDGKKTAPVIKDFTNMSTETNVLIHVVFPKGRLAELEAAQTSADGFIRNNGVEKLLKLTTTVSTTNMHLFTSELKLKKYATVHEIIADYFTVRMDAYVRRKKYMLDELRFKLMKMTNKARYIQAVLDDEIDLRRKTAQQVDDMLSGAGYDRIDESYKYLTRLPMDSVSVENVAAILRERDETEREFTTLQNTTETQMWLGELAEFEVKYMVYKASRAAIQAAGNSAAGDKKKAAGAKKVVRKLI